jgi:hypothetical protein
MIFLGTTSARELPEKVGWLSHQLAVRNTPRTPTFAEEVTLRVYSCHRGLKVLVSPREQGLRRIRMRKETANGSLLHHAPHHHAVVLAVLVFVPKGIRHLARYQMLIAHHPAKIIQGNRPMRSRFAASNAGMAPGRAG